MNEEVTIEVTANLAIFDNLIIQNKANDFFTAKEDLFKRQFQEITEFINSSEITDKLSYDNIYYLSKIYFFKSVLNCAVEENLLNPDKILYKIILSMFSAEICDSLYEKAIAGAFQYAISQLPSSSGLESALRGSKISRIQQKFLNASKKDN